MEIDFLFIGKTKEKYLLEGINDFNKRLGHYCRTNIKIIKEKKGKLSSEERMREEGRLIINNIADKSYVVLLDRSGKEISSKDLARKLDNWKLNHRKITIIVGGYLGVSREVVSAADYVMSLSKMTFTHELARVLIIEQMYRAFSILAGSQYHK